MSLIQRIADYLPAPVPGFDISPRFFSRAVTSSAAIPANAVTIAGVAAPIPILGPNDALWWESITGSFTGSVGTAVVTSIDSRFRDGSGTTLVHPFQPTVTTLSLALTGTAAVQFIPVMPLLLMSDLVNAGNVVGVNPLSQPFTMQLVFTYTNGSVANNIFTQEIEVVGRIVRNLQ